MERLANTYGGKFEKGSLDEVDTFGGYGKDVLKTPQGEPYTQAELDSYYIAMKPSLQANIIRITPEMKQKILEEGLPSFRMGGSVNNFIAPEDINIFA